MKKRKYFYIASVLGSILPITAISTIVTSCHSNSKHEVSKTKISIASVENKVQKMFNACGKDFSTWNSELSRKILADKYKHVFGSKSPEEMPLSSVKSIDFSTSVGSNEWLYLNAKITLKNGYSFTDKSGKSSDSTIFKQLIYGFKIADPTPKKDDEITGEISKYIGKRITDPTTIDALIKNNYKDAKFDHRAVQSLDFYIVANGKDAGQLKSVINLNNSFTFAGGKSHVVKLKEKMVNFLIVKQTIDSAALKDLVDHWVFEVSKIERTIKAVFTNPGVFVDDNYVQTAVERVDIFHMAPKKTSGVEPQKEDSAIYIDIFLKDGYHFADEKFSNHLRFGPIQYKEEWCV